MNNHYHLVLNIDCDGAKILPEEEVVERWCALHAMPVLIQRYMSQQHTCTATIEVCQHIIAEWREVLIAKGELEVTLR